MAKINKAALKAYFQTGKIPTQAQFGTLVDSFINNPSTDITERPNQNLFFGDGEDNPYIQGIRTISKDDDSSNCVVNMWIFSTYNNNDGELAIPMFILMRTSTKNSGLLPANNGLRYCIPNVKNIETFVQQGVDCNTSTDDDIFSVIYNWEFKLFGENSVENPSAPRIIQNGVSTYFVYPCKQNNEWYVGYVVEDEVDMGGFNQLYRLTPVGNSQLKWNISDGAIITDLGNHSKWTRKIM